MSETKHCRRCDSSKSLAEFYRNASTRDGHQAYCKPCWKADCDARRAADPDHRRAIALASYHRHKHDNGPRVWPRKPYTEKEKARRRLQSAVRQGKIVRQPCERCAKPNADAHHEDYSKPLDVRWVCRLCHAAIHREEAQQQQVA